MSGVQRTPGFGRADIDPSVLGTVSFSGTTMACTAPDGSISGDDRSGVYDCDTRILSRYMWRLDGEPIPFLSATAPDPSRRVIVLQRSVPGGTAEGPRLLNDSLELTIRRRVGRGMLDEVELANHSMVQASIRLTLEADADFADVLAPVNERGRLGRVSRSWHADEQVLLFDFHARHRGRELHRAARLRILPGSQRAAWRGGRLTFPFRLGPKGRGSIRLALDSMIDGEWRSPLDLGPEVLSPTPRDDEAEAWRATRARLEGDDRARGPFEQAANDLHALRLWERDGLARSTRTDRGWIPAAGAPLFGAVFGRDVLTAGWQSALLGPELMAGAVEVAARTQATRDSPFHDAEPGKMLHEARRGPLSDLGILPHRAYYGSQTTVSMFLVALSELWHWTGDMDLLRRYREPALRTFEWAERFGDLDGDGFLEYRRRSTHGPKNQGWKDSDDAIRYPDGRQVPNPIATVEEQAFHILALERMAELLVALGEDARADEFLERARTLARRWHEAFWLPEQGFYAMALDPDKRPVASIGSNVGHALGTGAVPAAQARTVAERLMAPDLFSGWGVRTLSKEHPSYNPFGYHLGAVWPVENATFALAFKRYGFDDLVERLVDAQLRAASHFRDHRLPEVMSGHGIDELPAPSIYPTANAPQAWSSSATVQYLQILLGLYPFAPLRLLAIVRPTLPEWLPTVTLRNVRVGDACVSLRFERSVDGSVHHEVVERSGNLVVLPAPPPDAEPEGIAESVKRWAIDRGPGRLLRALRIALGAER